jgi:hypothetical protein
MHMSGGQARCPRVRRPERLRKPEGRQPQDYTLSTAPCSTLPAVTLLTELGAFYTEHRRCGELDLGVDGAVVWIACDCARTSSQLASPLHRRRLGLGAGAVACGAAGGAGGTTTLRARVQVIIVAAAS